MNQEFKHLKMRQCWLAILQQSSAGSCSTSSGSSFIVIVREFCAFWFGKNPASLLLWNTAGKYYLKEVVMSLE